MKCEQAPYEERKEQSWLANWIMTMEGYLGLLALLLFI